MSDKLKAASKQVLTMNEDDSFNVALAIAKSSIYIDNQFKRDLFDSLKEDDQYRDLVKQLEDTEQPNEISVNHKTFRIEQGTLKVHEMSQNECSKLLANDGSKRDKYKTNDLARTTLCAVFWTFWFH